MDADETDVESQISKDIRNKSPRKSPRTSQAGVKKRKKNINRAVSADLSILRKSQDLIQPQVNYNSDNTNETSQIRENEDKGYDGSDVSDCGEEHQFHIKTEIEKPVSRLRRTLSGKFRKDNKIIIQPEQPKPQLPIVGDSLHKKLNPTFTSRQLSKSLKKGSNVDQIDTKGQTCLHLCCEKGYTELIKTLLKKGSNVNLKDAKGFTPLHYAALAKRLDICALLIHSKMIDLTVTNPENTHPLHYLVRIIVNEENIVQYRAILDLMINKGVNVNIQTRYGEGPLHFACLSDNVYTVAFLLERGADCNIVTSMTGETPLHYAVRKENIKLVRILMENGADPTIKATDGKTPIDVASENNVNSEVLDCLQSIIEEELEPEAHSPSINGRTDNLDRVGWLHLFFEESWHRCWTVADRRSIKNFKFQNKTEMLQHIVLLNASIKRLEGTYPAYNVGEENERLYCFELFQPHNTKTLFGCKSPEERENWFGILRNIIRKRKNLFNVYEKLKTLSKPRKRLRIRERKLAMKNCKEGISVLNAASKSQSKDEILRLVRSNISAAALSEILNPENEQLMAAVVKYFLHYGILMDFLKEAISHEIRKTSAGETLFREMSVATSVIRKYLEMDEGRDYVRSVALDLVFTISTLSRSLEVNPNNIGEDKVDINANLEKIIEMAQDFLDKVLSSASNCPLAFRELLLHTRTRVDAVFPNMTHAVVGGFVFLRYLCPAIVDPPKFGLLPRALDKRPLRVGILISKLLQSVSNGVEFDGSKEDYMQKFNPFIKKNRLYVGVFFDTLTNISSEKKTATHQPKPLSKEELAAAEQMILENIQLSKDKMSSLLTTSGNLVVHEEDSDDENSAVEADDEN